MTESGSLTDFLVLGAVTAVAFLSLLVPYWWVTRQDRKDAES